VLNFILGMSIGNIDNMCHFGGFLTGLLVGLPLGAFSHRNKILQVVTLVITCGVLAAGARELVQTHSQMAAKTLASMEAQKGHYSNAATIWKSMLRITLRTVKRWRL